MKRAASQFTFVLPSIYVLTILLTAAVSFVTPGGVYYRSFGICPPVAGIGMVIDNQIVLVGAFLLLGTPWWYLVGRVGCDRYEHKRRLLNPILGAAITLFTCFISAVMTIDPLKEDIRDGALNGMAILQYSLLALLCVGALFSTVLAVAAASMTSRRS